jgi:CRP-like cAMP-binding protein
MTGANVELLRRVSLFSGCSDAELETVAGLIEERVVPAGATVPATGSTAGAWFLVLTGHGKVLAEDREVAGVGPGDPFGSIAMVDGKPTRVVVSAITDMTLASVPASRLRELFAIGSLAAQAIRDLISIEDPAPR